jgi:IS5 family transposase
MARRRIGQEQLKLGADQGRQTGSLDEISALIDWAEIDRHLAVIYAAAKGEQAWPPLSLFKALLLAVWYDLSDVKLAEALEDRASFRRFCDFASDEPTPERTAFVRFRRELVMRSLDRVLFEAVTTQLDSRRVVVQTGTLVDATLIASASIKTDDEARWAGHRRKKPIHGDTPMWPLMKRLVWCARLRSRRPTFTMAPCWRPCCRTILVMFTGTVPTRQAA